MQLRWSNYNTIIANNCSRNSGWGIFLDSSNFTDVHYNTVKKNAQGQIFNTFTIGNNIYENYLANLLEAAFNGNYTTIIAGQSVGFTDTTTGGSPDLSYQWNFGDGTGNSTLQNPDHPFTSAAIRTVIQTVTDADGDKSVYQQIITVVTDSQPVAYFTINYTTPIEGQWIQFTSGTTGGNSPLIYGWDFGDGGYSSFSNPPPHQFLTAGIHTVTLNVTDKDEDFSEFHMDIEIAIDVPPSANFTANATTIIAGQWIEFYDGSTVGNGQLTYGWSFGDGTYSNLQNPLPHQFTSAATRTVTLNVTDADGDFEVCQMDVIIIGDSNPIAFFNVNVSIFVAGDWVQFTDGTTGGNGQITYGWDFGDGTYSNLQNSPIHQFLTPGIRTVILNVTDEDGDLSFYQVDLDIELDVSPAAYFMPSATSIVEGQWIIFTDGTMSGNRPLSYQWDFGDGTKILTYANPQHQFYVPGTYNVTLTVTDYDQDISEYQVTIVVQHQTASSDWLLPWILGILAVIGLIIACYLYKKHK